MGRDADAIIIGAGVIGAAIAFELGKRGYRTVNLDKLPAAGYGPTGNSCSIVRAHYSSPEGVAMAYEGFHYWQDWDRYLGVEDDAGLARYMQSGTILLKSATGHHEKVLEHYRRLGVEFEEWDREELRRRMPIYDTGAFWPPKRPSDSHFWDPPSKELDGAVFTPGSGYVNDPQLATHNLQRAAEAHGGTFRFSAEVMEIRRDADGVRGVKLADGEKLEAPVVVNVAGPHSFVINRMAGVEEEMNVKTRPLRHEVHHVPSPPDFDFESEGFHTSDGDTGIYFRPESGNNILIGSEDPDCDPKVWVDDPDHYDRAVSEAQWEAQVFRLARRIPTLPIPHRAQRHRRSLRRLRRLDPDLRPLGSVGLLHGDRHERESVQERARRRPSDGRADRPGTARARPRRRSRQGQGPLHRPRTRRGLLLAPARDQS